MDTTAYNLRTGQHRLYVGLSPRQAVIAAYAQTLPSGPDYDTWDYERRYGTLVEEGKRSYLCGDWAAAKEST